MNEPLRIKVELETVTPLFLGGAKAKDKNGPPDLRVPPFRGAMRYWWRAALGGVIGDEHIAALKQAEEAVFGSTNGASPIGLRIPFKKLDFAKKTILPHKRQGRRKAFEERQRFELVMTQYRNQRPEIWEAVCASLQLALTFGGVGLRSRRGHGTLRVTNVHGKGLVQTPTTQKGWQEHIKRVTERAIEAAFDLCQIEKITGFKGLPAGPAQFPCATKIGVIRLGDPEFDEPMDAVEAFMSKVPNKPFVGGISPRQASPLWVRPVQMDNKYGLLFVVLASRFRGSNYDKLNQLLSRFKGENIDVKGWNA